MDWKIKNAELTLEHGNLEVEFSKENDNTYIISFYDHYLNTNSVIKYTSLTEAKECTISTLNVTIEEMQKMIKLIEKVKEPK